MKQKYLLLSMILFVFLFLFSATSLALIPGDFGSANNGPPDGVVDFEDLMIFALAYGSTSSDSNWNEVCDIAGLGSTTPDGIIDFEDLMIFALHYGECAPPSAPILSDPGTTLSSPATYTVSWSAVTGASSYVLQEATSSDFTSGLQEYPLTDTSKDFSHTVTTTTTYYCRVAAINSCGQSGWSNVENIDIVTTYNVGDIGPAGGLIFYDKGYVSDGWRYLEAAPINQTSRYWGTNPLAVPGADGTAIGTGKQNTLDIIAGDTLADKAADECANYSITIGVVTYDDWFLPSKDELNLMYTNLHAEGVGGFIDADYWSSSEYNNDDAWLQGFYNGGQVHYDKDGYTNQVRAVRAFRSTASTYLVNYNANGATGGTVPSDSYHYEPGDTVTVLNNTGNLVKTGYTFAGWNTKADGSGTDQAEGSTFTMGTSDVTLYAKWTPAYTVTFDSQGGSAVDSQTVEHGGKATEPTDPTRTGYTFGGWYKESGCTTPWDFNTDTVTSNVTLYAKWTPTYTVTYNGNGSTGGAVPTDASNYEEGDTVTVLGNTGDLTRINDGGTSYRFAGWNTEVGGGGTGYNKDDTFIMGTSNVTLYAKWTPYALRDTGPAGGLIFYDRGSYTDATPTVPSWRYLEAAPSDQSASAQWGIYGVLISGADGTAVGTGEQNTIDIETGCTIPGTAADICANLGLGGYDDWFLPSKDELNLMYTNLKVAGVGGFVSDIYWSSSEYDAYYAWYRYFSIDYQLYSSKEHYVGVRAVRAF